MIEFLTANWLWILLGIGALWFFTRGHGMGCGMGAHSHDPDSPPEAEVAPHAGHTSDVGSAHEYGGPASAQPRRRHGCC